VESPVFPWAHASPLALVSPLLFLFLALLISLLLPLQNVPLIGALAKGLDCVFVNRTAGQSSGATAALLARVQAARAPGSAQGRIAIFPEGTTTNGSYLLKFRTGAFVPGTHVPCSYPLSLCLSVCLSVPFCSSTSSITLVSRFLPHFLGQVSLVPASFSFSYMFAHVGFPPPAAPVAPVLIFYDWKFWSPAYETISGPAFVLHLLTQFVQHVHVVHLPVVEPSAQEARDPRLFADRVHALMLQAGRGRLQSSDSGYADKRAYHALLKKKQQQQQKQKKQEE